jgi:fatty-acyl-CoA synthase
MATFTRHYPHWPPGVPKSLTIPHTSVYFNLEVSAKRYPDKTFINYYESCLSFTDVKRQVDALAGFLQKRFGVARGDRVLLDFQNSPQFIIGFYAILRADAVAVPVNPMSRTEELRHYVEDAGAKVALVEQASWSQIEPLLGASVLAQCLLGTYSDYVTVPTPVPVPEIVRAARAVPGREGVTAWMDAIGQNIDPAPPLAGFDDLAVMPYTSGTTGRPKGCMHTHGTVLSTSTMSCFWRSASSEGVTLGVLPLFHVTGMQANMNTPAQLGATTVLMSRWDREAAAMMIERAKVTSFTGITAMMVDFLANPNLSKYDLSSLNSVGGGGAAMPEAVAQRLQEKIGLPFIEGYGLTETMAPSHVNPSDRPKKQCAGIPFFDTDSRVVNLETFTDCGPNEVGEIITHGPQVFKGYWNQPKATEEAFIEHDGKRFFRTGDLGYYDEEGYFFITDRLKRMINASGFKVWPAEVEAMLYAHPDIQEACIIGTMDSYRGETVKALVVPKPASRGRLKPEEIIDWARERMAAYKVPRVVEFVDELPKTGTGKVFWRRLQEDENAKAAAAGATAPRSAHP